MLYGVYDYFSSKNSEQIKMQFPSIQPMNVFTSVNWNYLLD
jgi:hypothetical protein